MIKSQIFRLSQLSCAFRSSSSFVNNRPGKIEQTQDRNEIPKASKKLYKEAWNGQSR